METTFVLTQDELDLDFLNSLKKLFKHKKQLQISVSVAEDFNLMQMESPIEHLVRLEKCLAEVKSNLNIISFSERELDNLVLENL
jgi:hypothetical protein